MRNSRIFYITKLLLTNKAGIFLSCSVFILTSITGIISPVMVKNIVDKGIIPHNMKLCLLYAVLYLLCQIATIITGTLGLLFSERSSNKILCNQKSKMIVKLLNMKYCSIDQKSPAELNLIINSYIDNIKFFFADFPRILIELFFLILGSVVIVKYINKYAILLLVLAALINSLVYVLIQKKLNIIAIQKNKLQKEKENWLQLIFKNVNEFLINCGWNKVYSETSRLLGSSIELSNKDSDINYISSFVSRCISIIATTLIYVVSNHEISIGSVLATISFLGIILPLVNTCIDMFKYYTILTPSIDEIMGIEKMIIEEIDSPITRIEDSASTYYLKNVTFSYDQEYIFEDANISFQKQGIVVFQSKNGSGKSTLAKILLGLLNVENGSTNIKNDTIAYLPQSSILFPESILFNISLSETEKEHDELSSYFGVSKIDEFIFHDHRDLKASVSIDNSGFSEGEKRKICILRTLWFARNRDIIIMDEPDAGLDMTSVDILKDLLNYFSRHKLVILITHSNAFCNMGKKLYISDGKLKYE